MTFTLTIANEIVAHYHFLIGKALDATHSDHKITHILVTPGDQERLASFLNHFTQNANNQTCLLLSGYDPSRVKVLVLHDDTWGETLLYNDIDAYLTKMNIEKIY